MISRRWLQYLYIMLYTLLEYMAFYAASLCSAQKNYVERTNSCAIAYILLVLKNPLAMLTEGHRLVSTSLNGGRNGSRSL